MVMFSNIHIDRRGGGEVCHYLLFQELKGTKNIFSMVKYVSNIVVNWKRNNTGWGLENNIEYTIIDK